jgi:hypothetical protein
MSKVTATNGTRAFWVDPRDGHGVSLGTLSGAGERAFSTPEGWEDAVLILERTGG